jgi:hypothetical protein
MKDVTRKVLLENLYHQVPVALILRYAERHLAITKVYYSHKHNLTHKGSYTEISIECGGFYKLLVQRLPSGHGCTWHPWSFCWIWRLLRIPTWFSPLRAISELITTLRGSILGMQQSVRAIRARR